MSRVATLPARPLEALPQLTAAAARVRAQVLRMAHRARTPHVASALSCVDLLVALYGAVLRVDPARPLDPSRDRFILSKGHGCTAHYAVLAEYGFFPVSVLEEYATNGGRLAEHPGPACVPGIEVATGSLGHGLSIGAGLAYAATLRQQSWRTFVVLSDGECHEGSVWEAAMWAPVHRLDRLVAIVDYNRWSALGRSDASMALQPLGQKWEAFGWHVIEADGHDLVSLVTLLKQVPYAPGKPTVMIAKTVKGKGVSFMEDDLEWHYRPPSDQDLARALQEVGQG